MNPTDWLSKYGTKTTKKAKSIGASSASPAQDWLSKYSEVKEKPYEPIDINAPKPTVSKALETIEKKPKNFYQKYQDFATRVQQDVARPIAVGFTSSLGQLLGAGEELSKRVLLNPVANRIDRIMGKEPVDRFADTKNVGDRMADWVVNADNEFRQATGDEKKYMDQVLEAVGSSAPFLLGGIAGKVAMGARTGVALKNANTILNLGLSGTEALINAYDDYRALKEKDPANQDVKALASFVANIGVNYLTNKLGFLSEPGKKALPGVLNAAKTWLMGTGLEVNQEVLQGVVSDVVRGTPFNQALKNAGNTALVTLPMAGLFGVAGAYSSQQQLQSQTKTKTFLQDSATQGATKTEIAEVMATLSGADTKTAMEYVESSLQEYPEINDQLTQNEQKKIQSQIKEISSEFAPTDMTEQDVEFEKVQQFLKKEKPEDEAMFKKKKVSDEGITTKILKDLEGRETVSKQYILDATNRGDLKQVERDITREVLDTMKGDTINVKEFTDKVKSELLPLKVKDTVMAHKEAMATLKKSGYDIEQDMSGDANIVDKNGNWVDYEELPTNIQKMVDAVNGVADNYYELGKPKYENIALPDELRGKVKNYKENIYESPIKTSAGSTHFSGQSDNYFGHTRIEDMADNKTRRIIEVQSDLYQKGNLEKEMAGAGMDKSITRPIGDTTPDNVRYQQLVDKQKAITAQRTKETAKLQQYNDPTAHFRMVREEIKKAAQDGKTKLQFPTGETAMKIEGLVNRSDKWVTLDNVVIKDGSEFKVGDLITYQTHEGTPHEYQRYLITENRGDGTFKAVDSLTAENDSGFYELLGKKDLLDDGRIPSLDELVNTGNMDTEIEKYLSKLSESLSAKDTVDTNNPIYKFYEKDLGRYLKNKYNAETITDDNGVTWYEIKITPEMTGPVEAFKKQTEEQKTVSAEVGVEKIKSYGNRLGLNFPIFVYQKIYTGEMDGNVPAQAFGMYLDNTISLAQAITETTADHEIGHFVFRNLENIPIFKGITREDLYTEAKKKYGNLSSIDLEERLMEDFEKYAIQQETGKRVTFTGKIKKFFEALYQALKELFGISKRDYSSISKFYDTLYFGKSKDIISFENTGKASAFIERRFQEFGEDTPAFQKIEGQFTPDKVSQEEIQKEYTGMVEQDTIPVIEDMPPKLQEQQVQLEIMQDALKQNPASQLEKYVVKAGKLKGELVEVTGQKPEEIKKSPTYKNIKDKNVLEWIQKGDDIAEHRLEFGSFEGSEQAREAYAEYEKQVETFDGFKEEYKKNLREYKASQKDARAIERILNKASKETLKMIKENERHQAFVDRIFGKGFKQGKKTGIKEGKELQKAQMEEKIEAQKRKGELQKLRESITKRMYTNTVLDTLRKDIPRDEWSKYMTRLSKVGLSESKFIDLMESVSERKTQLDIEEGMRKDQSTVRQSIGFLKKVYDIEPSLILSIKQDLGIRDIYKSGERAGEEKSALKSVKNYSMIELLRFKEELQKRIEFRKNNPVHYFDFAKLEEPTKMQKLGKAIKKVDQNIIAPLERKVKQVSKPLYESLMTVFFQIDENNKIDAKNVGPIVDTFNKASKEDQLLITQYAQSADEARLRTVLEKYATPEEVDAMLESSRETLDRIHNDLQDVDVDVPYRKFFFPRKLKPLTVEQADLILKNFEYKMGKKATQEEKAIIMNNLLRGLDISQLPFITLSGKRFEAHRMLETIPTEMLTLYEDFATALKDYIGAANTVIEQRKFFGKSNMDTLDYDANLENSIGAKVAELQESGTITMEQTQEIKDALQTLFAVKLTSDQRALQQFTNDYIYPITLGQITSTLNQAKDLTMQTLMDLFKGQFNIVGKLSLTADDVSQSESIQELESSVKTSENKLAQFGKKVMTPFSKTDRFFLTVFINASYKRMVKLAKSDNTRFKKGLVDIFGQEEADRLVSELKTKTGKETASELPEGVTRWLYSEIAQIRPITKLQKTRGATRHPAWYTLRNFAIKQLEFVRSNSFDIIAEGIKTKDAKLVAEGTGKLVAIMSLMALWGASIDELKDWILGKDKESFWDKMVGNILQVIGLNNYMLNMAKQEGIAKQIVTSYIPAVASIGYQLFDDIISDVKDTVDGDSIWDAKIIKRVPLVGNIIYNRFGGGS